MIGESKEKQLTFNKTLKSKLVLASERSLWQHPHRRIHTVLHCINERFIGTAASVEFRFSISSAFIEIGNCYKSVYKSVYKSCTNSVRILRKDASR